MIVMDFLVVVRRHGLAREVVGFATLSKLSVLSIELKSTGSAQGAAFRDQLICYHHTFHGIGSRIML